jgi:murein DD-endopeptidase MepM/ murein hydrolase activator NlpD
MEAMIGPNHAAVSTDYKAPVTWDISYAYQNGHGADGTTHAAYDITCDDPGGNCVGTPIAAPVSGRVVCAGYGAGTGEAMASPNCTYSEGTTLPGQAHTIVLDVGTDSAGNAIQLSFNHMGTSDVEPGQTLNAGDMLGGMGDTDKGPHVHLEGWGWCPSQNTYVLIDPQLVVGGYYQSNAVC